MPRRGASLMLPEPSGWNDGRRTFWFVALGATAIVALILYWGVAAGLRGNYLTTVVTLGWAAFPAAVVLGLTLASFGRTSLHVETDSTGTTVLPDRRFSGLCLAGFLAFVPSGIIFVVFTPRGGIDIPMSRGMQIFAPIAIAGAVVVAVLTVITAWRRGGIGYLELSTRGIGIANIANTRSVDWDDIVEVTGEAEKRTRRAIVLRRHDGTEEIVESADLYAPRGVSLYWMVRHYWRHPEDRPELVDGRAIDRLRGQDFAVD